MVTESYAISFFFGGGGTRTKFNKAQQLKFGGMGITKEFLLKGKDQYC